MSKKTKLWFIIAVSLILIGCMIFGGAMTILKWDFSRLSTVKYETNTHVVRESFKNISITVNVADIDFVLSEGTNCSVVCHEQANLKHSVTVEDDSLVIEVVDTRKWYEHVGISFGSPKITLFLPQGEYRSLFIRSNTGDVKLSREYTFESIDIAGNTGSVTSYASASGSVKINTSTGDILVENISAEGLDLSVSTGKIT